jgi:hypothetical protein
MEEGGSETETSSLVRLDGVGLPCVLLMLWLRLTNAALDASGVSGSPSDGETANDLPA